MEWFIGVIIILFVIGLIVKPRRCDVCDLAFKRKYYKWTIEGKKQHLCPNCNAQMSRRTSSQRFDNKFGK